MVGPLMFIEYRVGGTDELLLSGTGVGVPPHAARVMIDGDRYRVADLTYGVDAATSPFSQEPQILTIVTVWLELDE